jgi:hypothetical protein
MAMLRSIASGVMGVPLLRSTGDRDLVAADVNVAVEGALHDLEELVTGAEQGDHRVVVRDHDLDLRGRAVRHSPGMS